jgi:putative transposase
MLLSLVYLLVGRVFGTGRRPNEVREIELLVLRHQMKVLQRQVKRPRLHRLDRLLLAAASRAMPRDRWSSFLGEAGDPAPLASGTRQEEVDI